jgi:hypothetical protein
VIVRVVEQNPFDGWRSGQIVWRARFVEQSGYDFPIVTSDIFGGLGV